MARRALDYLVGFNISPILWTKLPGSKSAGRVQSVALKLITEREHEIELFDPQEFWTLSVSFNDKLNNQLQASITQLNGSKIEKFSFKNKVEIDKAIINVKSKKFNISDISSKVVSRNPSGPFTTSTLQQVSSGRLGFGASRTMQIAQKLYQGIEIEGETIGLITYMRTDGTNLSSDAIDSFRSYIKNEFGKEYLPETPLNYSGKKAKNAQEAHEAIRPTDIMRAPNTVKKYLSPDQHKLYDLIWCRALSSQMESAKFDRNTITITSEDNETICKASGSVIKFDGFLKIMKDNKKEDDEEILPQMSKGEFKLIKLLMSSILHNLHQDILKQVL
jgi:DNA topoisomerase-1